MYRDPKKPGAKYLPNDSLEDLLRQRREQHHREREQHRRDVDEIGAEQVAARQRVSQPLPDAGQARCG